MFGEYSADGGGESPRLQSPWQALSASSSNPSPLALRSPNNSQPGTPINSINSTSPFNNELQFEFESLSLESSEAAIEAEVDKTGHIEYKLKLLCPSPLRLAKLTTQLRFRLVEGGGVALYELGVLDNGQVVGLVLEEMQETLATLGRMLSTLGGGEIKIVKVIRVAGNTIESDSRNLTPEGSNESRKDSNEGSDSGGESSEACSSTSSSSSIKLFQSFLVEDEPLELQPTHSIHNSPKRSQFSSADHQRNNTKVHYHNRSPTERASIKYSKKMERRLKKETLNGGPIVYNEEKPFQDFTQIDLERAAFKLANPKPVLISNRIIYQPTTIPVGLKYKPEMGVKENEVRYAVEAAVLKKNVLFNSTTRRRASNDLDDDLFNGLDGAEDEREEDEGWSHLDFDSIGRL